MAGGGMVGADPDQLDSLARTFKKGADELRAAEGVIGALVKNTAWNGTKAREFRGAWNIGARSRMRQAVAELDQTVAVIRRHAQEQREASAAVNPVVPTAPPDPRVDAGAGQWGSQPWYSKGDDRAVEEVAKSAATAADGLGYENAARHLRHYLNNSGEDLVVDPNQIARDNPNFKRAVEQQLHEAAADAIRRSMSSGHDGMPVQFTSSWEGTYLAEKDWYYAMGGIQHAVTGYVIVSPTDPSQVEVHYQTHVFDRYNWDGGKHVDIGPVRIEDERMGALHTAGLAKEYDLRGSTGEQVHIARLDQDGNVHVGEVPVAGDREGNRSDPGRDQQVGGARNGADGRPR